MNESILLEKKFEIVRVSGIATGIGFSERFKDGSGSYSESICETLYDTGHDKKDAEQSEKWANIICDALNKSIATEAIKKWEDSQQPKHFTHEDAMRDDFQVPNHVKLVQDSSGKETGIKWVKAGELPQSEKSLPDVVVTQMPNGSVFAYDTKKNIKGLREMLKHNPNIKIFLLNKSDESVPPYKEEEIKVGSITNKGKIREIFRNNIHSHEDVYETETFQRYFRKDLHIISYKEEVDKGLYNETEVNDLLEKYRENIVRTGLADRKNYQDWWAKNKKRFLESKEEAGMKDRD